MLKLKSIWPAARWTSESKIANLWTFRVEALGIESVVIEGAQRYLRSVGRGPDGDPFRFVVSALSWLEAERWGEQLPPHPTPIPLAAADHEPGKPAQVSRLKRVKDCARYPSDRWKSEWGEKPTAAEVFLWRRRWSEHLEAFSDGREAWDGATWGQRMPAEGELARAKEFLAKTDGEGRPLAATPAVPA